MLTVISNNFGADNDSILLKPKQTSDLVVLFGQLSVDTTKEEYRRAPFLQVEVQENFPFDKCMESAAYVIRGTGDTHDVTITQVFLKDKNTLRFRPVHGYDADGSYIIFMMCLLAPRNKSLSAGPSTRSRLNFNVTQGAMTGAEFLCVTNSTFTELIFKAESLDFGANDDPIKVAIDGLPSLENISCPVYFTDNYSSTTGSKFYEAELENGILTIHKSGLTESASASYKFFKIVLPTK